MRQIQKTLEDVEKDRVREMNEIIDLEYLERYRRTAIFLKKLYIAKKYYVMLKAVNYQKDKVRAKAVHSPTEQYAMKIEKLNKEIKEFEICIKREKKHILTQIGRIKRFEYQKVLSLYYIDCLPKWESVFHEMFCFEPDYEDFKDTTYRVKGFEWRRAALAQIEKISAKSFVAIEEKQLHINI